MVLFARIYLPFPGLDESHPDMVTTLLRFYSEKDISLEWVRLYTENHRNRLKSTEIYWNQNDFIPKPNITCGSVQSAQCDTSSCRRMSMKQYWGTYIGPRLDVGPAHRPTIILTFTGIKLNLYRKQIECLYNDPNQIWC